MSNSLGLGDRVLRVVGKTLSKVIALFPRGSEAAQSQELARSLYREINLDWAASHNSMTCPWLTYVREPRLQGQR